MKINRLLLVVLFFALGAGLRADSKIRIDTVDPSYTPLNRPTEREPVSVSDFQFEINPERTKARIVVNYTYPDRLVYGPNDDARGPLSSVVQLPGLTYQAARSAVIYSAGGRTTVCAAVTERSGIFGRRLSVKNTGACTVSAALADHVVDDGWTVHRVSALDVYLDIR